MEERIRIQTHLEQLREQCIREYLEGQLEAIASKEVVNDILVGLLQASNREFLDSIAENILEVRTNNRQLKDTIERMKAESEEHSRSQAARAKEESKQLHLIEISQLREQLSLIKLNLEADNEQNSRRVTALTEQLKTACRDNQQLKDIIVEKNQLISKLEREIQESRQRQSTKDDQMADMEKKQKEREEHFNVSVQTLMNDKERKMLELVQDYQEQLKQSVNEKQQLAKQHRQQINKYQADIQQVMRLMQQKQENLTASMNHSNLLRAQILKRQQQLSTISSLLARSEQKALTTLKQLQAAANEHQQAQRENNLLINQLRQAKLKVEEKAEALDGELKQRIAEIGSMQLKERSLQQSIKQKQRQNIDRILSHKAEIQALNDQILSKERRIEDMQRKIDQDCEAYLSCQEEIKNLLKYNAIHQEETAKYEAEIVQLRQESKAEITTYQQTYSLTIDSLEQEIRLANEKIAAKRGEINMLQEQLQGEREKDKYYALYLQEIAVLKHQLYKQASSKSSSLASRNLNLIAQLREEVRGLSAQNSKLKACIQTQLSQMQADWQQSVRYFISQTQVHAAKCLYYQHQKKLPIIQKPQISMDRTVPKGRQVQTKGSIKRNLQSIQQKYLLINQQNKSFASRVESLLHG